MGLDIIILAAGKGKRMNSDLPKVLHKVAGKSMLAHVIESAQSLKPTNIHIVVGHGSEQVKKELDNNGLHWCIQSEQLGTGHAVQQALPDIEKDRDVLILYGDVPLLTENTLSNLLVALESNDLVLLTAKLPDPSGYGRIVRDLEDNVERIVEQKDANESELKINEVNTGILATNSKLLNTCLSKINNKNSQQEFYLTDCIQLAVKDKKKVEAVICDKPYETLGVNNNLNLAQVERYYQRRVAIELLNGGVTLMDPERIDVRGSLKTGKDVLLDVNTVFVGDNVLEDNVCIEANTVIINSHIKSGTIVHANTHIENAVIGENCELGPFARIRPDTNLNEKVKVGNFVEIKKSNIKTGSKINHLSYIGDTDLGKDVNIGAGTITCNYDGANKHKTIIGDNVFVGSNTQFVAPVTIGEGATIGAGSTITKDTPKDKLTLSRSKQITIETWQRPQKEKK